MSKPTITRWAFDLSTWKPTIAQMKQAVAALQVEERARIEKFCFIDDFLSSLVGRLLMRKYVSASSGLNYHEVQFARDIHGKPYWLLDNVPNEEKVKLPRLSFNVSHQGKFVVLAGITALPPTDNNNVTVPNFGIGVDVMEIEYSGGKPLQEFFRLMQKKFSKNEWTYIRRPEHSAEAQLKAFMRHWCLKEAFVKELGVGITIDLQQISFSVDQNTGLDVDTQPLTNIQLSCDDYAEDDWHFEEHLLAPKYCAAIAFKNCKPKAEKFVYLNIEDLLVPSDKVECLEILNYCENALLKPKKPR
ncbi:L-aminoadipate-semialdehyde dehydrogenase-phosphopantetheinyl transferase [Teleopsis dalmanni]|uniref:L-aminoadipate-semialdehyde dehydrogenase-phosphopantetheinyl transferase n=1 Tax=Teleopsis dalmanni TaxID=139649 RepID=UPI0018CEB30C|nr:L-aminoadipate-semialdehyde dehydrogenase-phosphopantetheinyl transferase [Teleopsis dalmanni]